MARAPFQTHVNLPYLAVGCLVGFVVACGPAADSAPDAGGDASNPPAFVMPRDTDILLAELHWEASGPPAIGEPTNLTGRVDYDNQPFFVPDGSGLWYTANDPQSGQTDIWRYDFETGMVTRVTSSSPESEYSATPLPDGSGISTIRVEADSAQRLWRFDPDGSNASVILENVAPVGYHAWIDQRTVAMFVLGDPPTLQVGDLGSGSAVIAARNIGRSIWRIPDGTPEGGSARDVSFVQRQEDGSASIMRLPASGGEPQEIAPAVDGQDFHAWTPDGTLLTASGGAIWAWVPERDGGWVQIADFTRLGISISRLAVSPDGSQIAIVAEPAPIEGFAGN